MNGSKMKILTVLIFTAVSALCAAPLKNGAVWYDTNGHTINAHGGSIVYAYGRYWWYGEHKVYGPAGNKAHVGIHCYSSVNLTDWRDEGTVFDVVQDPTYMETDGCVLEMAKVIFRPEENQFIMFMHLEQKGHGYRDGLTVIARGNTPNEKFMRMRIVNPNGNISRDMTVFTDDDGRHYQLYASTWNNRVLRIDELSVDCKDYTGRSIAALHDMTEAPMILKRNGWYFIVGSGCSGWKPNTARLYRSRSLEGPWEKLGNPCKGGVNPFNGLGPEKTWGAQSCWFLPRHDLPGEYIAVFDVWNPENQLDSRYLFLPVSFTEDSLEIHWQDRWMGIPEKKSPLAVTLTFDDGTKDHLKAADLLESREWRGTFNIVTDMIGKPGYLDWDDVKRLQQRGHEISSHTRTHGNLVKMLEEGNTNGVIEEITASRDAIEKATGKRPRFVCHPYVRGNAATDRIIRDAGMEPMGRVRYNHGRGTKAGTPTSLGSYLDRRRALGRGPTDLLFHAVEPGGIGYKPFDSLKDFEDALDELKDREQRGLVRVMSYGEFSGKDRMTFCKETPDLATSTPQWIDKYGKGEAYTVIPAETDAVEAADGKFNTVYRPGEHNYEVVYEFDREYNVRASRLIWAGTSGRYRLDLKMLNGEWRTFIDATDGRQDLAIDYREITPAEATAARLTVTGAVSGSKFTEILEWTLFEERADAADPVAVGKRIAEQFLSTDPAAYNAKGFTGYVHDGSYVPYAVVSLWVNSLEFARNVCDKDLERRLLEKFEPLLPGGARENLPSRPRHVDFSVFGALPLQVYLHNGDKRAYRMGMRYAERQWMIAGKNEIDVWPKWLRSHFVPLEKQFEYLIEDYSGETRLWIDDMYMINLLQTQAYRASGDDIYIRRAAKEMCLYLDKLQLENGLFNHAADVPYVWGRGAGWMAAGMPMILWYLDKNDPHFEKILAGYRKMMAELLKWQRPDGLWGQLVTDADSWSETSGSAMFAYGMLSGVKKGWLNDAEYRPAIEKVWKALVRRLDRYGNLADICVGTGARNSRDYYLQRARLNGDPHGQAPMMWLAALMTEDFPKPKPKPSRK